MISAWNSTAARLWTIPGARTRENLTKQPFPIVWNVVRNCYLAVWHDRRLWVWGNGSPFHVRDHHSSDVFCPKVWSIFKRFYNHRLTELLDCVGVFPRTRRSWDTLWVICLHDWISWNAIITSSYLDYWHMVCLVIFPDGWRSAQNVPKHSWRIA